MGKGIGFLWKLVIFFIFAAGAQSGVLAVRMYSFKQQEKSDQSDSSAEAKQVYGDKYLTGAGFNDAFIESESDQSDPSAEAKQVYRDKYLTGAGFNDAFIESESDFWVKKIMENLDADGHVELPSQREILIVHNLACGDDDVQLCNVNAQKVRNAIIEKLTTEMKYDKIQDALDYWMVKILLGHPVPTRDQILAIKMRNEPCLQDPVPCEKQVEELINTLNGIKEKGGSVRDFVEMKLCRGDDCNPDLRSSVKKELGMPTVSITPQDSVQITSPSLSLLRVGAYDSMKNYSS